MKSTLLPLARFLPALLLPAFMPASAQLAAGPSSQTYTAPNLGLSMTYPAGFSHEDPARFDSTEFSTFAYATQPSCVHVVLALSSGLDLPAEKPKKGQAALAPSTGSMTLSEVDRACLDKTQVDDSLMHDLVGSAAKTTGMTPLGRMTNYGIEQSTVWWTAQAGYLKDVKGKRAASAGTAITATAGASVHGHLLIWTIVASDPELFNRFAGVWVCFSAPACPAGPTQLTQFRLNVPHATELASR